MPVIILIYRKERVEIGWGNYIANKESSEYSISLRLQFYSSCNFQSWRGKDNFFFSYLYVVWTTWNIWGSLKKKSILINISWLINLTRGSNIPNECHYWSEPAMESYRVFSPTNLFFYYYKNRKLFYKICMM